MDDCVSDGETQNSSNVIGEFLAYEATNKNTTIVQ